MLNRITIMGRMTRNPELRRTQSGTAVTSFTLAVDRDFKGKNREQSDPRTNVRTSVGGADLGAGAIHLPRASEITKGSPHDFSRVGEKETDFIDVVAWRATAEFVARHFTKGRMAVAEGRLQIRDWTDKDGGKRRSAEVIADSVYFGDSKPGGKSDAASALSAGGYSDFSEIGEEDSGELPF